MVKGAIRRLGFVPTMKPFPCSSRVSPEPSGYVCRYFAEIVGNRKSVAGAMRCHRTALNPQRSARPVFVLTITDRTPAAGNRVEPCVKAAAAAIGIKDCSVCETIRYRRPARGHVLHYLDQIDNFGIVRDGCFCPAGGVDRLSLSEREWQQLRNVVASRSESIRHSAWEGPQSGGYLGALRPIAYTVRLPWWVSETGKHYRSGADFIEQLEIPCDYRPRTPSRTMDWQ